VPCLLLLFDEFQDDSDFAFGEGLNLDEESFSGVHARFILVSSSRVEMTELAYNFGIIRALRSLTLVLRR
jgi:hypothetical protein